MRFLVLWGALLPFVLRVVAGACVGRWTGQPRMPPRERQHEGFWFFVWGIVSHAQEWSCGAAPPQSDGTPPCGGAGEGLGFLRRRGNFFLSADIHGMHFAFSPKSAIMRE